MPRRLAPALALAAVLAIAASADSKQDTVTMSGRAYAFNHSETGLAGAVIRVRELPKLSAVADANGDYELEVPDETTVTPYIEPPPGYHQIDLQTFHTRGKPIPNANFQTPGDAEYNGLAALLDVPLGPDGRPVDCVIVTTASARNVRGVDFETFQERTPHGVAGATARTKPALPGPVYFNESVIPDRTRTETSGDGGIIWTEVPAGVYRGIAESPSTRFASFLATCKPGRIVNANPPWGAYELTGKEKPLGAGIVAGSVEEVKVGARQVTIRVEAAEPLQAKLELARHGERISKAKANIAVGGGKVKANVPKAVNGGPMTVSFELTDKAGDSIDDNVKVETPGRVTGVETVERLLAALRARDAEATAALLHPEIVATGDKGTFEGIDAVVAWAKPSDDGHLVSRVEVDEIRAISTDHVVAAARRQWRWKEDPDEVADETPFGVLFELRDGRIYRWRQNFPSIIDAIEART